jgi:hypothetical protein
VHFTHFSPGFCWLSTVQVSVCVTAWPEFGGVGGGARSARARVTSRCAEAKSGTTHHAIFMGAILAGIGARSHCAKRPGSVQYPITERPRRRDASPRRCGMTCRFGINDRRGTAYRRSSRNGVPDT